MSEPVRHDAASSAGDPAVDRDARIEELLLIGLDYYFAANYEQAIHVWTRVLFLDRGHARARAYIERARGAVSERQRECEELLYTGLDAFNRGDTGAARQLLTSAVERGAPADEALAFLGRLDRLEAQVTSGDAAGGAAPAIRPAGPDAEGPRARWTGRLSVALSLLVIAGVGTAAFLDRIMPLLPFKAVSGGAGSLSRSQEPLPIPAIADVALARARALYARGRLREALRALDTITPGDPLASEADALRAEMQRVLLAAIPAPGGPPVIPQ
ncbi:MAG: hypothetical protein LC804_26370 [Acidobacteria bacterium]|nr:hypothetical protein [Acidobacteriota bacterium]